MPFSANWGPSAGLLFKDRRPPLLGVLGSRHRSEDPIGIAWLAGSIPSKRGPVQLWRLEVRKVEFEGAWIVKKRESVRLGAACDRLD